MPRLRARLVAPDGGYRPGMNPTDEQVQVTDFAGLRIEWDRRVLEPRPWTAEQGKWAAELAEQCPDGPILELCCGAGQIGLLAAQLTGRSLVQVDRSEVAAAYARQNAAAAGVRTTVRATELHAALGPEDQFPLIIADPPWLPSARVSEFPDDPVSAVDGGDEGVDVISRCLEIALPHLVPDGRMVLQVGTAEQVDYVRDTLAKIDLGEDEEPAHEVSDVRDLRPSGLLVLIAPVGSAEQSDTSDDAGTDAGGTVSEAYQGGGETIIPGDSTAGYPLDKEGGKPDVQEGAAGPNAVPPENDRARHIANDAVDHAHDDQDNPDDPEEDR